MAGIEAVLCYNPANGTLLEESSLAFPSARAEVSKYYLYPPEANDVAPIHVSRKSLSRTCAGILCKLLAFDALPLLRTPLDLGQNSIQLEAWLPLVYVRTKPWSIQGSDSSFVELPCSGLNSQIRYILQPNDSFVVGERQFVLQLKQTSLDQEVQVTSSRPNEVDDGAHQMHPQESKQPSGFRPSTPSPGSGPAVMETPMTDRHLPPLNIDQHPEVKTSSVHGATPKPLKPELLNRSGDNPMAKSSSDKRGSDVNMLSSHDNQYSADMVASTSVPPSVLQLAIADGDRQRTRKRPASHDHSEQLGPGCATVLDLESASSTDDVFHEDLPRKRQKRINNESQNSIRSTIHVEVPDMVQGKLSTKSRNSSAQESGKTPSSQKSVASGIGTAATPQDRLTSSEPPSTNRSTRSIAQTRKEENQASRVYFASSTKIEGSPIYTRFLRQKNIVKVKHVSDCDILCTGNGELKRTSNLILAILAGKDVVTDQWVVQSAKKEKVLPVQGFVPEDPARALAWGTSLSDAIDRGRHGVKPLDNCTVYFTPGLKKELGRSWSELKEVSLAAGATVPATVPRESPPDPDLTIVVAASNDPDIETLNERGWKVFTKDIITYSALRGAIDTSSDEFLLPSTKKGPESGRKKRKKG